MFNATVTIASPFIASFSPHAGTEVVNRDLNRRLAASLLPERVHPSGRRWTLNEAPWRNGSTLEKPDREQRFPISTLVEQEPLDQYLKKFKAGR